MTLEPVRGRIDERFSLLYGAGADAGETAIVLSGATELVEPLPGNVIDIGEAVAQELSLALDPYPRAPGAARPTSRWREALAAPFAALAKLEGKTINHTVTIAGLLGIEVASAPVFG